MYQVQLFKRDKSGKKGELASVMKYQTAKQANVAAATCGAIKQGRKIVPCDIECSDTGQKITICSNYIARCVESAN